MKTWRVLVETLIEPVAAFRALVESPRSLVALLLVCAGQLSLPWMLNGRVDTRATVLSDLEMSGKLGDMTDHEVDEAVVQKAKIVVAGQAASALVGPPMLALEFAIVLWLWSRYLRGKPSFGVLYSLCAHVQLPLALRSMATASIVYARGSVRPDEIDKLLPSGIISLVHVNPGPWMQALGGADFFRLWVAVLLGVALYVSGPFKPARAVIGMGLAYAAFVAVFLVALPNLGGA
jgi:hypothetical protein